MFLRANCPFSGSDGGFDDAAVEEMNGALGVMGVARVVGDHADGGAIAVQFLQKIHDGVAIFGVEIAGGLIGEKDEGSPTSARATATRCC